MEDLQQWKAWGLRELNASEMEIRGGFSWQWIKKAKTAVETVVSFLVDYSEEITRGFKQGWNLIPLP